MSAMIRRRHLKLEQEATKQRAMSQEIQYAIFDAMKISYDDRQFLDAIADRGEPRLARRKRKLLLSDFQPSSKGHTR
jgi:hypothetical protein